MRPERLVLVCGTATEVGKTWVSARVLGTLRASGHSVAARKPAQSFDVDHAGRSHGGPTDAEVLAAATGEPPEEVCHPSRSYRRAMAPPIAAEALGLAPFTVADLAGEVRWPDEGTEVGLVETAGGVAGRRRRWWWCSTATTTTTRSTGGTGSGWSTGTGTRW